MNYFEIITRVLQELKYPTVTTFANLTNPEHLQIKKLVNTVNRDVLLSAGYNVREKTRTLTIPVSTENYTRIYNSINGEIKRNGVIVDNDIYNLEQDISKFITGNVNETDYCIFGKYLYFGSKNEIRTANIMYLTYEVAENSQGVGKDELTLETDTSILPSQLIEQILVYGTCYYFKGSNSADARMAFWLQQYNNGIKALNGFNQSQDQRIEVIIPTNKSIRARIV